MHKTSIFVGLVVMVLAVVTERSAVLADVHADARHRAAVQRAKAEHDRRVAEMKLRANPTHRGLPPVKPAKATPARDFRGNPVAGSAKAPEKRDFRGNPVGKVVAKPPAIPFNASSAPPPEEALKSFVAAASKATSMDALLHYLPAHEARALKEEQANYDPRDAVNKRQQFRKLNANVSNESLKLLTNSPYQKKLDRLKRIADNVLDIMKVKVDGNKATVRVSTNNGGVINGVRYEYSTAEIELVGEGNEWKFSNYNESPWVYKDQPR